MEFRSAVPDQPALGIPSNLKVLFVILRGEKRRKVCTMVCQGTIKTRCSGASGETENLSQALIPESAGEGWEGCQFVAEDLLWPNVRAIQLQT